MLFVPVLFLFLAQLALATPDVGMTCDQHPKRDLINKSVLIRSWKFFGRGTAMMVNGRVAYYPAYKELSYSPRDDATSKKYHGLDLFYVSGSGNERKEPALAELYFQRSALVYIFVDAKAAARNSFTSTMQGWQSEGWAVRTSKQSRYFLGLYQKVSFYVTQHAYVFSKRTQGPMNSVVIPNFGWVLRNTPNIKAKGSYHIRVAEASGGPSTHQTSFRGVKVSSNARCPDILHDAWSTANSDSSDATTARMRFGTWHPQWDPCLWCAYDHEHGSAAPLLMDYTPKYGLTEHKNKGGVETNQGFKDFVFAQGNVLVYVSVHVQTSKMRRVDHALHTVTLVMKRKGSGELLVELSFKGDFGFLAARKRGRGDEMMALTRGGAAVARAQRRSKPYLRAFRTINVVNMGALDGRFQYNYPARAGTYEEWVCRTPCATTAMGGELTFDVQDPITGIKSMASRATVWLGDRYRNGVFRPNLGLKRTVRARGLTVSARRCGFGDRFKGGVFYTDVYGKKLKDGPGAGAVRQFIKPGFVGGFSGKFSPAEYWRGMHHGGMEQKFFLPHGYGINHYVN